MVMKVSHNTQGHLYFVFRVLVGIAFMIHGGQKLFGWFGGNAVDLTSKFGAAGIIEFVGGLAIILGLFVSTVATIAALEMLVALFTVHFKQGLNPLTNNGEPAWLFFAAFLVLAAYGAGKYSLERALLKKEICH
jgi:putative oxidoreductase